MKNTITIILCLVALLMVRPVLAKEKLAVMNLQATAGVSDATAYALSDVLRDEIHAQGEYEVLSKEDLDALARRTSLQMQAGDFTDAQFLANLGKALGSKYMVYGSLSKVGRTYSLSLRLLNTEGKEIGVKNRVNERCQCSEDELFDQIVVAAAKIMGKKVPTLVKKGSTSHRMARKKIKINPILTSVFNAETKLNGIIFTGENDILSFGRAHEVELWNLKKDSKERSFQGASGGVNCLALSLDQQLLVAGTDDGYIVGWRFQDGQLLFNQKAHGRAVTALAISPDSKIVASADNKGKFIKLWNGKFARQLWEYRAHKKRIHSLAFSADGSRLYSSGDDKSTRIWDIADRKGEIKRTDEPDAKYGKLIDADYSDKYIVLGLTEVFRGGKYEHNVKVRDLATGEMVVSFGGHLQDVSAVAISPFGRYIASASPDMTVRFWDIQQEKELTHIPVESANYDVKFSRDGKLLATIDEKNKINVYQL